MFPPNREYQTKAVTVAPGGTGFFFDYDILLPQGFNGPATAYLKCNISYGRVGRSDNTLELNKNTAIVISGSSLSGAQDWYDLAS